MPVFVVRYDLRCPPDAGISRKELYGTALEQAAYADANGFTSVVLSEHHGVDDGYLPSPLVMAGAVAAVTSTVNITIAALLTPLYDPLRLAEDIAVLDHISGGRLVYVMGLGYRPEEYEMLGLEWSQRGRLMERCLATLQQAWTGEPFEYEGRTVRVTPTPVTQPHPLVMYGGGSPAAARRAAKFGLGFFPQHADKELEAIYHAAREEFGTRGFVISPPEQTGTFVCSEDPDQFWGQYGDRLLYEARAYSAWQGEAASAVHDTSTTVDEMRAAGVYRVCTPDELIELATNGEAAQGFTLHPLIAGLSPDVSWESLRLVAEKVIPAITA